MRILLIATTMLLACSASAGEPDRTVNVNRDQGIAVIYGDRTPEMGSGNRVRQIRPAGDFTRVVADDALDVEIRIGPSATIELEGDDNLIDRIRTEAENGTLHLRVRGGYRVRRPMVARITMPRLDRVDLEASGDARIAGLNGGRLALAGHGSGSFHVDGAVDEVEVRIQGSGDADLQDLRAREAHILINGSGDASTYVTETIVATVNGTGEVTYRGDPRNVTEDVNGTGRITRSKN
ncbi:MAG TPA: head GIN domain-containing protein [Allosphingosinicella sp.]|nr:head GIN domain-containing protein [Allosphingosinicella sp.]